MYFQTNKRYLQLRLNQSAARQSVGRKNIMYKSGSNAIRKEGKK